MKLCVSLVKPRKGRVLSQSFPPSQAKQRVEVSGKRAARRSIKRSRSAASKKMLKQERFDVIFWDLAMDDVQGEKRCLLGRPFFGSLSVRARPFYQRHQFPCTVFGHFLLVSLGKPELMRRTCGICKELFSKRPVHYGLVN